MGGSRRARGRDNKATDAAGLASSDEAALCHGRVSSSPTPEDSESVSVCYCFVVVVVVVVAALALRRSTCPLPVSSPSRCSPVSRAAVSRVNR